MLRPCVGQLQLIGMHLVSRLLPSICRVIVCAMLWKLLLTFAVILGAYGIIRARIRSDRVARGLEPPRPPLFPPGLIRLALSAVLTLMVVGSSLHLYTGWQREHEVVLVQVVNANTGQVMSFEALWGSVDDRRFQTIDGREIRLADVERMIVVPKPRSD
jgi:hypothetical protein